jgi:response regulator of citrate/malate metabolism
MIRTLIVDDDFRVAGVHAGFVEEVEGFAVVGTAHTAAEARARVRELAPDLILLDVYLPDESGLAVLPELQTDTIVLSAATDRASVAAAIRAGALNYLIKPFTTRQLAERLTSYARFRGLLAEDRAMGQDDVDRAYRVLHDQDRTSAPKGQSTATSRLVSEQLRRAGRGGRRRTGHGARDGAAVPHGAGRVGHGPDAPALRRHRAPGARIPLVRRLSQRRVVVVSARYWYCCIMLSATFTQDCTGFADVGAGEGRSTRASSSSGTAFFGCGFACA